MLRVIETTDNRYRGLEFNYSISTLEPPVVLPNGYIFTDFRILHIKDNKYKIYNSNYVVIVLELEE